MSSICTTTDDMPDVNGIAPAYATTSSTRVGVLRPMLAKPIKTLALGEKLGSCDQWIVEEKYDGERLLVTHNSKDSAQMQHSRFLKDITERSSFQHRIGVKSDDGCVFDGELVYRDADSHAIVSMCETGNRVTNLYSTYIVFDIQCYNGEDVCDKPLIERKRLLETIVEQSRYVQLSKWQLIENWRDVTEQFNDVCARGGEGLMLKRKNEPYCTNKRQWIKVKPLHIVGARKDYELFAHKLLRDKNGMFNVIVCGFYENIEDAKSFIQICRVASGLNGFTRNTLQQLIDSHGYFRERQVVAVVADKKTIYGHLRHPVFQRLRFDLNENADSINANLIRAHRTAAF